MKLFHVFIYDDEYEGDQIDDFVAACDTLQEGEHVIKNWPTSGHYAYIASFDDSNRQWTFEHFYEYTREPLEGQKTDYLSREDYYKNAPFRWLRRLGYDEYEEL